MITSDRLRSSRGPDEDDGRPIRAKKHKYQDSDFIYSAGSSTSTKPQPSVSGEPNPDKSTDQPQVCVSSESKTATNKGEKLYPKRDRTKTAKFEEFFSNNLKKSEGKFKQNNEHSTKNETESVVENAYLNIDISEVESNSSAHADKAEHGNIQHSNTKSKGELEGRKCDSIVVGKTLPVYDSKLESEITEKALIKIDNEKEIEEESLTLESDDILELSDELLLQNIEACMEIIKDESKQIPSPTLLELSEGDSSNSETESIIDDDVSLIRVKIPKHIQKLMIKSKAELRDDDDDDVPLSHLMKSGTSFSGATIKNGKLKRPVGRPRKYPIVTEKVKRPVGRPRKEKSENKNGAKTLPNGQVFTFALPACLIVTFCTYPLFSLGPPGLSSNNLS